ncbi:MAG: hypothetical protein H7Y07_04770 [Pyrinomonadaceae bacterium]|nr:hypothetical protein [Sphingobacteriaceae bacterium]
MKAQPSILNLMVAAAPGFLRDYSGQQGYICCEAETSIFKKIEIVC